MVKITQSHGYRVRELRKLEKKTPKAVMAVRLVWEGYPAASASDILGVSARTVSTYVHAWNAGRPGGLGASP